MHEKILKVATLGNIPYRDAALVVVWVQEWQIYEAIRLATMWELRDRVIQEIHEYTEPKPEILRFSDYDFEGNRYRSA